MGSRNEAAFPDPTLTLNARAARALVLTFVLSFVNLLGAFLAMSMLGGLEPWTDTQFVGFFGLLETGLGLGFLVTPNIWRLPVAEAHTSDRTQVRLAATTALIPHWIAGAKALAGIVMLVYAGAAAGVSPATPGLAIVAISIALSFIALSLLAARVGIAFPEKDVFFVTVKRPGGKEHELPGLSVTGVIIQVLANIGVFPAVAVLSPGVMYQPEMAASPAFLGATVAIAAVLTALALAAWWTRISWRAPREQQREAERELSAAR